MVKRICIEMWRVMSTYLILEVIFLPLGSVLTQRQQFHRLVFLQVCPPLSNPTCLSVNSHDMSNDSGLFSFLACGKY